jgi:hypothetical protein
MLRLVPLFMLLLTACGYQPAWQSRSSVTVKLPPPKPAVAPGFSASVRD